ncbi:MAG TPA: hypothetical protein VFE88_04440 [Candidatus Nanoarchaeia archaeon]|nr:hypothetical protein [Candidatus Nanoarchaeia archaeon]
MVISKKGFIRILEAIIAIVLVFGYLVTILPKAPKSTGEVPPELDNTLKAVLKRVQNDPAFREDVLVRRDVQGREKLRRVIGETLPPFSVWKFAFKVCTSGTNDCIYFAPDSVNTETGFNIFFGSPEIVSRAVYTRSAFLSQRDASAPGPATLTCVRQPTAPPRLLRPEDCENQVISLYMWSSI